MINLNLKISCNIYKKGFPDLEHYSNTLDDFFFQKSFLAFCDAKKRELENTETIFNTRPNFSFFRKEVERGALSGTDT